MSRVSRLYLFKAAVIILVAKIVAASSSPVNILMILADDLGYGDTSVHPFTGTGIRTPNLEKMAAKGTVMTNFHAAAATCTPTRASILTGMYPWRSGIKAVYEYGNSNSNRNDWLPQLPTSAMTFLDAQYFTGHSGKWHLGGMRNDDLDLRRLPDRNSSIGLGGSKRCPHPGPNQQGFMQYVSVLDGPGSPRQNDLQTQSVLYSQGCTALLNNDIHIGRLNGTAQETLCDCEARHAIRMMKESIAVKKPFFIQLWFHAPHGPWEKIRGFESLYPDLSKAVINDLPSCDENHAEVYCRSGLGANAKRIVRDRDIMSKYKTMVSSMDSSIGMVLDSLVEMGIEKDTLVVFTSDNGPENMTPSDPAGTAGGFRGTKRHLHEGGIRVPSIWQWVGQIPKGRNISTFGMTTDLYPTFLDAAGVTAPSTVKLDGISLLPLLTANTKQKKKTAKTIVSERIALWHNDFEGSRASALWVYDFKILLDAKDSPSEMFDMKADPYEKVNLLKPYRGSIPFHHNQMSKLSGNISRTFHEAAVRGNPALQKWILSQAFPLLSDFIKFGNEAHILYLAANAGRKYVPTPESDVRTSVQNPYKLVSKERAGEMRKELLNGTCGAAGCTCALPVAANTPSLPFSDTLPSHHRLIPGNLPNASTLLTFRRKGG